MIQVSENWKKHAKDSSVYDVYAKLFLEDELVITDENGENMLWLDSKVKMNPDGTISVEDNNEAVIGSDGAIVLILDGEIQNNVMVLDARVIRNDDSAVTAVMKSRIITENGTIKTVCLDGTVQGELLIITGNILELRSRDFAESTLIWDDDLSQAGRFKLGLTGAGRFSGTIIDYDGKYRDFDFRGSAIKTYAQIDSELCSQGVYYIDEQHITGMNIKIAGYDRLASLDKPILAFSREVDASEQIGTGALTTITWQSGATIGSIVRNILAKGGIKYSDINVVDGVFRFPNDTITVDVSSDDVSNLSARDVLDYCIEMAGCYGMMNYNGRFEVRQFKDQTEVSEITKISGLPQVGIQPYKIFGVLVKYNDTYTTLGYEGYGYIYTMECPLITTQRTANSVASAIYNALYSIEFIEFSLVASCDPTIEIGDLVSFEIGDTRYTTYLTSYSCRMNSMSAMSFEGEYNRQNTWADAWKGMNQ